MNSRIPVVTLIFALAVQVLQAGNDAALMRFTSPIIDLHTLPTGGVRMYSQQLDVYDAVPSSPTWFRKIATVNGAKVRRVSQVLRMNNVVLAVGHILTYDGAASVVLRSTDFGSSFTPVVVGTDTLAITDVCTATPQGQLFFVDRVGRLWMSSDLGTTWITKRWPSGITPGAAREVDMIDANTGVCVDGLRGVHFTTDAWTTLITPLVAKRPITRTQPSMINSSNWSRSLVLVQNTLYLTEATDVYRTPSSDLIWERWDSVAAMAVSADRKLMALFTIDGTLKVQKVDGSKVRILETNALPPHLLRIVGDTVIAYRPDTGPVIYAGTTRTQLRPLTTDKPIADPSFQTPNEQWGVLTNTVDAQLIDIVRKDGKGLWHRDTVARFGPVRSMFTKGTDTVVFNTNRAAVAYVPSSRKLVPYTVNTPLKDFLKHPIVRFRLLCAADELDSTHVRWVEYVAQGNKLVCAELVDSSNFGVKSQLITNSFTQDEIKQLLQTINEDGEELPTNDFVQLTPDVLAEYNNIVDTIFSTDAYFDPFDMYKAPPAAEDQARSCWTLFKNVVDELPKLTPEVIADAFRAYRHVPHDGHSRYVIEFQNRSGRLAVFSVDRADEAHPPLMLPWRGYCEGQTWQSFTTGLTALFSKGFPSESIPPMFAQMSRPAWYLVSIASYLDAVRYGRRHRWSNRVITPAARFK